MYSRQLSNVLRMGVQPLVKFRQGGGIKTLLYAGITEYPALPINGENVSGAVNQQGRSTTKPSTTIRRASLVTMIESDLHGDMQKSAEMTGSHQGWWGNRMQFCDVRDASQQGKKKGDVFTWDVFSDVATAGGVLTETNTMPESNFTIVQGTLTICSQADNYISVAA